MSVLSQLTWSKVIVKAWADKALKEALEKDPFGGIKVLYDKLDGEDPLKDELRSVVGEDEQSTNLFVLPPERDDDDDDGQQPRYLTDQEWTTIVNLARKENFEDFLDKVEANPLEAFKTHKNDARFNELPSHIKNLLDDDNIDRLRFFRVPDSPAEYFETQLGGSNSNSGRLYTHMSSETQFICFCCFIPGLTDTASDLRGL